MKIEKYSSTATGRQCNRPSEALTRTSCPSSKNSEGGLCGANRISKSENGRKKSENLVRPRGGLPRGHLRSAGRIFPRNRERPGNGKGRCAGADPRLLGAQGERPHKSAARSGALGYAGNSEARHEDSKSVQTWRQPSSVADEAHDLRARHVRRRKISRAHCAASAAPAGAEMAVKFDWNRNRSQFVTGSEKVL